MEISLKSLIPFVLLLRKKIYCSLMILSITKAFYTSKKKILLHKLRQIKIPSLYFFKLSVHFFSYLFFFSINVNLHLHTLTLEKLQYFFNLFYKNKNIRFLKISLPF